MKAAHLVSEMSLLRFVLGILIFIEVVFTSSDDKVPPSIVQDLERLQYFKKDDSITLQCTAKGSPKLTYEWTKDGKCICEYTSNVKLANGYLNITSANQSDEGYYQCSAKNNYGTAMSDVLHLHYAMINVDYKTFSKDCKHGRPCQFDAIRKLKRNFTSVPSAKYSWSKGTDAVKLSKRIQMDDDGSLYFANVLHSDSTTDEEAYTLSARNEYLNESVITVSYTLNVLAGGDLDFPRITDICKQSVTALVGSSAKLRCFFSGNPEPNITWTYEGEKVHKISNFDTELEITDVSFTDQGFYDCAGSNGIIFGNPDIVIRLLVEEAPKFVNDNDHPYDATVQVGQNLTFHCNAEAVPKAKVAWYVNGIKVNVKTPPPRFQFSEDRKSLTVVNVCSECEDRHTDMMVIQCNASNLHGYAFRNGYVKVVDSQHQSTSTSPSSGSTISTSSSISESSSPSPSESSSESSSPSSSPPSPSHMPISKSNKAELTNWLILLTLGWNLFCWCNEEVTSFLSRTNMRLSLQNDRGT